MSKHTPGPWTQDGRHVEAFDGKEITMGCEVYGPEDEAAANARLIAACPEMYELLQEYYRYNPQSTYGHRIVAILAKAEGRKE